MVEGECGRAKKVCSVGRLVQGKNLPSSGRAAETAWEAAVRAGGGTGTAEQGCCSHVSRSLSRSRVGVAGKDLAGS